MIKQLLICAMSVMTLSATAQEIQSTIVWEGDATLTWDATTAPSVEASKCADIIAGDKIVITVSNLAANEDWPGCYFRTLSHVDLCSIGLWDFKKTETPFQASVEVPYDASVVNGFREGFYAVGSGATLSEISILHSGDPSIELPTGDNVLWFGPATQLTWSSGVDVAAAKTENIEAGQFINITVDHLSSDEEWPQIAVNSQEGWKDIAGLPLWDDREAEFPLVKSFEVTEENLPLVKAGFHLGGVGAWITTVTYESKDLSSSHELPAAEITHTTVYSIQGIFLKIAETPDEAIKGLPHGIYIINGKKVII